MQAEAALRRDGHNTEGSLPVIAASLFLQSCAREQAMIFVPQGFFTATLHHLSSPASPSPQLLVFHAPEKGRKKN